MKDVRGGGKYKVTYMTTSAESRKTHCNKACAANSSDYSKPSWYARRTTHYTGVITFWSGLSVDWHSFSGKSNSFCSYFFFIFLHRRNYVNPLSSLLLPGSYGASSNLSTKCYFFRMLNVVEHKTRQLNDCHSVWCRWTPVHRNKCQIPSVYDWLLSVSQ